MTTIPLNLGTGSNQTRLGYEGAARFINCYVESLGENARTQTAVYASEGLDPWLTVSASGGIKCFQAIETKLYGVAGRDVFSVDINSVVTILLTLAVESPCYMARNRRNPNTEVGLVTATGLYYVIVGNTITLNADPDLQGPPSSIAVRDGLFIIPTNFNRYFITNEDNATQITATDFGRAQRNPDEITRAMASETDIVLFGASSIEWHQNQPNALGSFPFVPIAQIEIGLIGPQAVAKLDRSMVWVASDGTVRLMQGYGGVRISNHAVERAIGSLLDPTVIQCFGWNSKDTSHSFMCVTCPSFTWVYDFKSQQWHERQSYGLSRWRATQSVEWQGMTLVGDYATGTLYQISGAIETDAASHLVMTLQTPPVDSQPRNSRFNWVELEFAPGLGNNSANPHGADPKVMMSFSDDGGRTWSAERMASLGPSGVSNVRAFWTRLGQLRSNARTFRFSSSADVARCFISASMGVTVDE